MTNRDKLRAVIAGLSGVTHDMRVYECAAMCRVKINTVYKWLSKNSVGIPDDRLIALAYRVEDRSAKNGDNK